MLLCHDLRELREEHTHHLIIGIDDCLSNISLSSIGNSDYEVDLLLQNFIYYRLRSFLLNPHLPCEIRH